MLADPAPVPAAPSEPVPLTMPPSSSKAMTAIPEDLRDRLSSLTLKEIVDLGLRNSPKTRATWAAARSAADEVGVQRAEYYPDLDVVGSATRSQQPQSTGGTLRQTTFGASVALDYLLFDFGERRGNVESAQQALLGADWTHNQAIQDVMLDILVSYYTYLDAKAQLAAAEAGVAEAEANLEAANVRREAGVATVADVLQAKTALSQARLVLETVRGQIHVLLGALATSMGLPANVPFDVGSLPEATPTVEISEAVENLIDRAIANRPEIGAARSRILEEQANVTARRGENLPRLTLEANGGRFHFDPSLGDDPYANSWAASVLLTVPVFNGFERKYAVREAKEDMAVAQADADALEQAVVLSVWTSYYGVKTASERVKTARDLLDSATESEQVALARYKEGVGSILDLLTAQAALASARALEIQARSDWFVAMAHLAHDTGILAPRVVEGGRFDATR